jgi:hypothetical protein
VVDSHDIIIDFFNDTAIFKKNKDD